MIVRIDLTRCFFCFPWEADLMDPQQNCMSRAAGKRWRMPVTGTRRRVTDQIGVFAGVTWNEYSLIAHEEGFLKDQYKDPGSLYWGIPNRVSYFLDLHTSIAVDTACSSSLVAVHQACHICRATVKWRWRRQPQLTSAKIHVLSQSHFLSSEGKCRSFGEGGDGYVPGEGAGAVLLKPLKSDCGQRPHLRCH